MTDESPDANPSRAGRKLLSLRTPEDLVACVPVVFGFMPEESVVMMTLGGRQSFHARADLPSMIDLDQLASMLLEPVRRHTARTVAFLTVSEDPERARLALAVLAAMFEGAGVEVAAGVAVDGHRWWGLGDVDALAAGTPYDVTGHPFHADAVLRGEVLHRTRDDIAALVSLDAAAVAGVAAALASTPYEATDIDGLRAVAMARRGRGGDQEPTDLEVAWLLRALGEEGVADEVAAELTREQAKGYAAWWASIARRSPDPWSRHPAALAAMAAWLAGDGALAWCAVDRVRSVTADHPLAELVAELIETAESPIEWERRRRDLSRPA